MTEVEILQEMEYLYRILVDNEKYNKIDLFFPDTLVKTTSGDEYHARELYAAQLLHFNMGATYNQRTLKCANQIGKTTAGAIELVYHLTGNYPKWWQGKRFAHANNWWVVGETQTTVKQHIQPLLLGPFDDFGSGLVPRKCLDSTSLTDATKTSTKVESFRVNHISGEYSLVEFKSFDQGRTAFQSAQRNIWLDEEPPLDVYTECLTRTISGDYILYMTFTPLKGVTELLDKFTDKDPYTDGHKGPSRWMTTATWEDCPHLSQAKKIELKASYPEHEIEARTMGIPILGSGKVYPMPESMISIEPFAIPRHYKRFFAFDFGWEHPTCGLWAAVDPETGIRYYYHEHSMSETPLAIHASVINQMNKMSDMTIPGVCDPSGGGTNMNDGNKTRTDYKEQYGITFESADNSVEPGIANIIDQAIAGKIKVFTTLTSFWKEYRLYRREKGKIVKKADDLMDCWRYSENSGIKIAKSKTEIDAANNIELYKSNEFQGMRHSDSWLYS